MISMKLKLSFAALTRELNQLARWSRSPSHALVTCVESVLTLIGVGACALCEPACACPRWRGGDMLVAAAFGSWMPAGFASDL